MKFYRTLPKAHTYIMRIGILLFIGFELSGCDPFVTLIMRPTLKGQYEVKLRVKKEYLVEDSILIKMASHNIPRRSFIAKRLHATSMLPDTLERHTLFNLGAWNEEYFSSIAGVVDTLVITTPTATVTYTDSAGVYSYLSTQPLQGLFNHKLCIP